MAELRKFSDDTRRQLKAIGNSPIAGWARMIERDMIEVQDQAKTCHMGGIIAGITGPWSAAGAMGHHLTFGKSSEAESKASDAVRRDLREMTETVLVDLAFDCKAIRKI